MKINIISYNKSFSTFDKQHQLETLSIEKEFKKIEKKIPQKVDFIYSSKATHIHALSLKIGSTKNRKVFLDERINNQENETALTNLSNTQPKTIYSACEILFKNESIIVQNHNEIRQFIDYLIRLQRDNILLIVTEETAKYFIGNTLDIAPNKANMLNLINGSFIELYISTITNLNKVTLK